MDGNEEKTVLGWERKIRIGKWRFFSFRFPIYSVFWGLPSFLLFLCIYLCLIIITGEGLGRFCLLLCSLQWASA